MYNSHPEFLAAPIGVCDQGFDLVGSQLVGQVQGEALMSSAWSDLLSLLMVMVDNSGGASFMEKDLKVIRDMNMIC